MGPAVLQNALLRPPVPTGEITKGGIVTGDTSQQSEDPGEQPLPINFLMQSLLNRLGTDAQKAVLAPVPISMPQGLHSVPYPSGFLSPMSSVGGSASTTSQPSQPVQQEQQEQQAQQPQSTQSLQQAQSVQQMQPLQPLQTSQQPQMVPNFAIPSTLDQHAAVKGTFPIINLHLSGVGSQPAMFLSNGYPGMLYSNLSGFSFTSNSNCVLPTDMDPSFSKQASNIPSSQSHRSKAPARSTFKAARIRWTEEMNRDLENVYDKLRASCIRPTQRVVHEILKEKYPFMTELHVQSKLQKLRHVKKHNISPTKAAFRTRASSNSDDEDS